VAVGLRVGVPGVRVAEIVGVGPVGVFVGGIGVDVAVGVLVGGRGPMAAMAMANGFTPVIERVLTTVFVDGLMIDRL